MAGAGVVAGASAAATSQAGVVQITLSGNQITSGGANTLNTDFTNDGQPDMSKFFDYTQSVRSSGFTTSGKFYYHTALYTVSVVNSKFDFLGAAHYARGFVSNSAKTNRISSTPMRFQAQAGGLNSSGSITNLGIGTTPQSVRGLTPVTFTDARINGGTTTNGFLDTQAFNTSITSHTVQLVRLVFNDSSTSLPSGVTPGGTNPEFDPTVTAQRAKLSSDIKKLSKKAKKLKKKGKKKKAKKLSKKIKKLESSLAALG